ncbi:hypothetical protein ACP70R_044789 [Stipagrostis hirtigluma subsp. patula]
MRSSSASRVILVAVTVALLVVLAVGVCGVAGDSDGRARQPAVAPPAAPVLGVSARARLEYFAGGGGDVEGGRMLGGAGGDYGFVDPPPDTHRRRGGTAPIPHN